MANSDDEDTGMHSRTPSSASASLGHTPPARQRDGPGEQDSRKRRRPAGRYIRRGSEVRSCNVCTICISVKVRHVSDQQQLF